MIFEKFANRAFNRLVYKWKISGALVASYLLGLSDHYILSDNIKSINLEIFEKRFLNFALYIDKPRSTNDNFV